MDLPRHIPPIFQIETFPAIAGPVAAIRAVECTAFGHSIALIRRKCHDDSPTRFCCFRKAKCNITLSTELRCSRKPLHHDQYLGRALPRRLPHAASRVLRPNQRCEHESVTTIELAKV